MIKSFFTLDFVELQKTDRLKDLIWKLERGQTIEYDFDTVKLLESAIDEIEEYRKPDYTEYEITEMACELDDEDVKTIIKNLQQYLAPYDSKEVTVNDLLLQVDEWYNMTLKELRVEADYNRLKVSGAKKEIIERLKNKYLEEHTLVV